MKNTTKPNGTNKPKNEKPNLNNLPEFNLKPGIIFLILINLLAASTLASDGMMCGTVDDLEKIFKTNATTPDDRPPVDYIISKATYDIIAVDNFAETKATYDIEILTDNWVKIKLQMEPFAFKSVELDGKEVSLITEYDLKYLVLNNEKGKHKLIINFLIEINEDDPGNTRDIKLGNLPETAISELLIEIPETDIGIEIKPAFDTEIKEHQNKTIATATLVSGKGISVVWHPKREDIIIEKEEIPAKVYADVSSLISVGEGVMKCHTIIDYSIVQGSTDRFKIRVPADVSVLEITDLYGRSIKDYKIDDNVILIQLPQEISNNYKIILNYEKEMEGTSAVSNIPEIKVLDVERETGHIGIEARTNVEINAVESSWVQVIDVQELPQDIWSRSKNPLLFGYKYLKHPYSVTLDIKKHEDIPVLVATIDYAEIITVLTEDGKSITKATYYVKNNRKQFLEVSLPQGSEMWGAFVSGSPVKPAKNDNNKILIPLSKSYSDNTLYAFPVEFVYISDTPEFGYFGKNNYEIPDVDIPVSEVNLLLYLPEDYDFIKFDGDMKEVDYFRGYRYEEPPPSASRTMVPQVSNVNYADEEKVDYKMAEGDGKGKQPPVPAPPPTMPIVPVVTVPVQQFQDELQEATEKGVLPVRINIPQSGKVYRFSKLLVVEDKKLGVSAAYIDSGIYTLIGRLVLLFILAVGFYVVRELKNLRSQLTKILLIIIIPLIVSYFLENVWYYVTFGWTVVVISAVVYRLYIFVKGYVGRRKETKIEEKNEKKIEKEK